MTLKEKIVLIMKSSSFMIHNAEILAEAILSLIKARDEKLKELFINEFIMNFGGNIKFIRDKLDKIFSDKEGG